MSFASLAHLAEGLCLGAPLTLKVEITIIVTTTIYMLTYLQLHAIKGILPGVGFVCAIAKRPLINCGLNSLLFLSLAGH
jgi:hypothetical protein